MLTPSTGKRPSPLASDIRLTLALAQREIESRYRGSLLGMVWSMLTPLLMLGVYTFVFGTVFKSRWSTGDSHTPPAEFAVILFTGLIIFQIFSETVIRAPSLMIGYSNYVKKVVFPLEILVPVALCNSLFHGLISFAILLPFLFLEFGGIPLTALWLPVVILPLLMMTLGIGWFLASIGTYSRDIGQVIGTLTTALLFLGPIFFPTSSLPGWVQSWVSLNPIAIPIEQARKALVFGQTPEWGILLSYYLVAIIVCAVGFLWFQKTRKGFADVL